MKQYSAYSLHPTYGWTATHRLPLASAIYYCREIHRRDMIPVAVVPDTQDPTPFLKLVENL